MNVSILVNTTFPTLFYAFVNEFKRNNPKWENQDGGILEAAEEFERQYALLLQRNFGVDCQEVYKYTSDFDVM